MSQKPIFISYSHDSEEHKKQVLELSERLRQDGIETRLDQYVNGAPEEKWPRWMLNQLDEAQFVLVVCTETYYLRFRGHEQPGKGKGVDWEGALITQELYDSRSKTLKFVPVFLNAAVDAHIPEPLRSTSYYALTSEKNYQNLYDFLLGQAGIEPYPVGTLKIRPRQQGTALTFDEPRSVDAAKIDISRIIKYAPAELIGREAETKVLNDAWKQAISGEPKRPHVLTFVALGGEGKTSLVAHWAAELAHDNWPGCEAVFAWSFYSQGTREQAVASSDLFLDAALEFFGEKEMAGGAQHASERAKRLAQLVGAKRALLILDGVEPLQYAPTSTMPGELKDAGLATLLKGLAASSHGLCVVTTRYAIPDLNAYRQTTAPEIRLLRLSTDAGVDLLHKLGVKNGSREDFEKLVEDVRGHALTLNLLGAYLRDAHHGDIRKRDLIKLEEADAEEQGGHAFRVMDAYVQSFESEGEKGRRALALLRLLGLFDRPAPADCFYVLLKAPAIPKLTELLVEKNEPKRNIALTRLEGAGLLTVNRDTAGTLLSLDAHPLLREYFAKQIREQHPGSWREAHRRLYKHLIRTKEGAQPTLAELQPLYQAVAHGCLAGMGQEACEEVYHARILRENEKYSTRKFGAFGSNLGAVTCFFDIPWSRISPALTKDTHGWLFDEAGSALRAMGRLVETIEPMRAALEMAVKQENWKNAAIGASNLSELELTLGELNAAVSDAGQSVRYADQSGDVFWKMTARTSHADALHQAGRMGEANALFKEAESMQAKHQPDYPLLYSMRGFHYCDLLLATAECAAWKKTQNSGCGIQDSEVADACRSVSERAAQTLQWAKQSNADILSAALDHLTLGRAALYAALLEGTSHTACHESIEHAVDGLRRSGNMDDIPRGLLTRAWLLTLENRSESAKADLAEALEIAERGPMQLHMADIYLHRARLFFRATPYPWNDPDGTPHSAKQDLAEARRLIEKHGYWRRKEELEDAESVILRKP
ncbi:MAG: WD repeat-containing [Gallionellaceae bacterium]|nr:MAG: WD repeat-containing [Gallionellaceae bacterium]